MKANPFQAILRAVGGISNDMLVRMAMFAAVLVALDASAAMAQSAPASTSTSTVFCNIINYIYPASTRAVIAVIAGMGAIAQMWSESSTVFAWIKRHQTLFIFCIALMAGPTAVVLFLGSNAAGCAYQ